MIMANYAQVMTALIEYLNDAPTAGATYEAARRISFAYHNPHMHL